MSEIKSTLDLVMERTRNLTLSAEEKEKQKATDVKRQLAGLMQKYQDQVLTRDELTRRLDELKSRYGQGSGERMADAILRQIGVTMDNGLRLSVLSDYFGLDISILETVLAEFKRARQQTQRRRLDQLKSDLADAGISGSAVIPNIGIDLQWQSEQNTIVDRFQSKLDAEKKRFSRPPDP
jgi:hypothetical protein